MTYPKVNPSTRTDRLPAQVRQHYPFEGQLLTTRAPTGDPVVMHFVDEGKGNVLLFVHGNPTWSFYWRQLISEWSKTHRCIAVDHVGCGLSDKPQEYPYTLAQHIDNLTQLIETLDLRDITLVVHDWGGPIGLGTALRHRERFRRIVLFNTGCFEGPIPPEIRMCRWPGWGDAVIRGLNGFVRVGLFRATADPTRFANGVGDGYLAPYGSWHDRVANLRFIQDIPIELSHPTRPLFLSIGEHLRAFAHLPVAILWGERDFCFTAHYRREFIARLPQAEVTVFDDAGHWVVEDAFERIMPILMDFFARHPVSAARGSSP